MSKEITFADCLVSACPEGDARCLQTIYGKTKITFCYELIGFEAFIPQGKNQILSWRDNADRILTERRKGPLTLRGLFSVSLTDLETELVEQLGIKRLSFTRPPLNEQEYKKLKGALNEQFESLKSWHNARRTDARETERA